MDKDRTEYVVVCRGDAEPGSPYAHGAYELATRTVFPTREAALAYSVGIAAERAPLVVEGRWSGLRRDAAERFPRSGP
jgi:hypothetical protein